MPASELMLQERNEFPGHYQRVPASDPTQRGSGGVEDTDGPKNALGIHPHHGARFSFGLVAGLLLLPVLFSSQQLSQVPEEACYAHPEQHLVIRRLDEPVALEFLRPARNRTVMVGGGFSLQSEIATESSRRLRRKTVKGFRRVKQAREGHASACAFIECSSMPDGGPQSLAACEARCTNDLKCNVVQFCPDRGSCNSLQYGAGRCCLKHCQGNDLKLTTKWLGWDVYFSPEKVSPAALATEENAEERHQAKAEHGPAEQVEKTVKDEQEEKKAETEAEEEAKVEAQEASVQRKAARNKETEGGAAEATAADHKQAGKRAEDLHKHVAADAAPQKKPDIETKQEPAEHTAEKTEEERDDDEEEEEKEKEKEEEEEEEEAIWSDGDLRGTGCSLQSPTALFPWVAGLLFLLLKAKSVESMEVLTGGGPSARREGFGGYAMRLVGLWGFWGPTIIALLTLYTFHGRFFSHTLEIVSKRGADGHSYYAVSTEYVHMFRENPELLSETCSALPSLHEWRQFSATAFGLGAAMTFALGAVFMGLGELFRVDHAVGYLLEALVSLGFLKLFTTSILQDPLMQYYETVTAKVREYSGDLVATVEEASHMIDNLQNLSLEACGGSMYKFGLFFKRKMLEVSRPHLEPVAMERHMLAWDEVEGMVAAMNMTKLIEGDPDGWLEDAMASSAPFLAKRALAALKPAAEPRVQPHGLLWDEVVPIASQYFNSDQLHHALSDLDDFMNKLLKTGPLLLKCSIKKNQSAVDNAATQLSVKPEDLEGCLLSVNGDALTTVVTQLPDVLGPDVATMLDKLFSSLGPAGTLWKLARIRSATEPKILKIDSAVEWNGLVQVVKELPAQDLEKLEVSPEEFMENPPKAVAMKLALFQAKPKVEPSLGKYSLSWKGFEELMQSAGSVEDVRQCAAAPDDFLSRLEEWQQTKEEKSLQDEEAKTKAMVNLKQRIKVIWPALMQNAATALWLMANFVEVHPCVGVNAGAQPAILLGLVPIPDMQVYLDTVLMASTVMLMLTAATLVMMFLGMRFGWQRLESRGPLVIMIVLALYLVVVTSVTNPFKSQKKGLSAFWNQASGLVGDGDSSRRLSAITLITAVATKMPLNLLMGLSYAVEAASRVFITTVSEPTAEEQKLFKDARAKDATSKQKELEQAAPPALKQNIEQNRIALLEANYERREVEAEVAEARESGHDFREYLREKREHRSQKVEQRRSEARAAAGLPPLPRDEAKTLLGSSRQVAAGTPAAAAAANSFEAKAVAGSVEQSAAVAADAAPVANTFEGKTTPASVAQLGATAYMAPVADSFEGKTTPASVAQLGATAYMAPVADSFEGKTTPASVAQLGATAYIAPVASSFEGKTTPASVAQLGATAYIAPVANSFEGASGSASVAQPAATAYIAPAPNSFEATAAAGLLGQPEVISSAAPSGSQATAAAGLLGQPGFFSSAAPSGSQATAAAGLLGQPGFFSSAAPSGSQATAAAGLLGQPGFFSSAAPSGSQADPSSWLWSFLPTSAGMPQQAVAEPSEAIAEASSSSVPPGSASEVEKSEAAADSPDQTAAAAAPFGWFGGFEVGKALGAIDLFGQAGPSAASSALPENSQVGKPASVEGSAPAVWQVEDADAAAPSAAAAVRPSTLPDSSKVTANPVSQTAATAGSPGLFGRFKVGTATGELLERSAAAAAGAAISALPDSSEVGTAATAMQPIGKGTAAAGSKALFDSSKAGGGSAGSTVDWFGQAVAVAAVAASAVAEAAAENAEVDNARGAIDLLGQSAARAASSELLPSGREARAAGGLLSGLAATVVAGASPPASVSPRLLGSEAKGAERATADGSKSAAATVEDNSSSKKWAFDAPEERDGSSPPGKRGGLLGSFPSLMGSRLRRRSREKAGEEAADAASPSPTSRPGYTAMAERMDELIRNTGMTAEAARRQMLEEFPGAATLQSEAGIGDEATDLAEDSALASHKHYAAMRRQMAATMKESMAGQDRPLAKAADEVWRSVFLPVFDEKWRTEIAPNAAMGEEWQPIWDAVWQPVWNEVYSRSQDVPKIEDLPQRRNPPVRNNKQSSAGALNSAQASSRRSRARQHGSLPVLNLSELFADFYHLFHHFMHKDGPAQARRRHQDRMRLQMAQGMKEAMAGQGRPLAMASDEAWRSVFFLAFDKKWNTVIALNSKLGGEWQSTWDALWKPVWDEVYAKSAAVPALASRRHHDAMRSEMAETMREAMRKQKRPLAAASDEAWRAIFLPVFERKWSTVIAPNAKLGEAWQPTWDALWKPVWEEVYLKSGEVPALASRKHYDRMRIQMRDTMKGVMVSQARPVATATDEKAWQLAFSAAFEAKWTELVALQSPLGEEWQPIWDVLWQPIWDELHAKAG
eukprot:TRINITY_DN51420_c0_g1_i2.p1 TRINITY_DN51420_c0_g1~~TRINITY_DN51420_c0_g1_i2.p1  ORF type:complete len:2369 (+),score=621.47 TRINITY_DN51420_c0_g1_i2:148-7254(+)